MTHKDDLKANARLCAVITLILIVCGLFGLIYFGGS